MPQVVVRITEEQALWLDSQVSQFRPKSAVLRGLIDSAMRKLDSGSNLPAYCVGAETPQEKAVTAVEAVQPQQPPQQTTAVPAVQSSKGKSFKPVTRGRLEKFDADIQDFWKSKKGAKNSRAWSLLQTELEKILDKYGETILVEQLHLGTQMGTWRGISLTRYEQFKPKAAAKEPEFKHPASKVFTAKDFDVPRNASLEDLF